MLDREESRNTALKFNPVGHEEPAAQVLVPRLDRALRRRMFFIVGLAVVAMALLILVSVKRIGVVEQTGGAGSGVPFHRGDPRPDAGQ